MMKDSNHLHPHFVYHQLEEGVASLRKCSIQRMASRQDKEQRPEERQVSSDLRVGTEHDPEDRPGVMGSVMRAVHSAKEAVVGKSRDEHGDGGDRLKEEMTESAAGARDGKAREVAERATEAKGSAKESPGEMTDKAKEAVGETKDYSAEKTKEMAEKTKETAECAKEKTTETAESAADKTREKAQEGKEKSKETAQEAEEKTKETTQSAVDKTKETAQSATSKLGELKGKAMGLFSGKKEQKYETAEEKLREFEEETRRRMEELRLKGRNEYEGEVARRVREDKGEPERRGGGILGALGTLKEKLTSHPSPCDQDKSQPMDESREREPRTGEEKQVVVEDVSSPGTVESNLKASDQASGQTLNEVGRIDDEGVVRVVRLDRRGKK